MKGQAVDACLVVTLCKAPNYGAYLQAFALKSVLESYGYHTRFLDIYDKENTRKLFQFYFRGWKQDSARIPFNTLKFLNFKRAEKKLRLVARRSIPKFRVAFIGSDEIWSVTNSTFNSAPEFFGLNLDSLLKFSYAPSVGSSRVTDLIGHPKFIDGLRKLDRVSVRDSESFEVATALAGRRDVELVLDPTFLYDFSGVEMDYKVDGPFLLIYTYGFSRAIVDEVRKYALEHKLLVVSAGFRHAWADKNLPCSPFEFLTLVKNAHCVITDTFHGSIFAIKYRKDFVCFGGHKQKVRHLLETLGLHENLVDTGYLANGKEIKTDYRGFDKKLQPLLTASLNYIEECNATVEQHHWAV